ncbi:SDR family oxidoreductase [Catenuloplanes indicus]|uniref:NAD(P)-dependent dehydrogenase (Short-subunit alcohol dehydrogenase family) n=1 Tax=Catenuloplanes indicus TaxID=137267 RepID=A0AAE3VUH5_9ACTN|nr:SDR family oxidoreductase [Catenuloplanes indicus]MDQ0363894.1 NAD(P)-dependent dehydrogenase (short-subunit alcohol dehydrogenase family) [Catenuloplanes indicus]
MTWALILGVSSGMGRATAVALAETGLNIAGLHFDTAARAAEADALRAELDRLGVKHDLVNANAAAHRTRAEVVPRLAELAGDGGLRVLVHSLAFGTLVPYLPRPGFPDGLTSRQLTMTLEVMAHSLVHWTQDLAAAGLFGDGAKIFALTSSGTTQHLPSYGAVSAAKSALESHVRQLALELAPRGVAVNALRAGVTVTPSLERIPEHAAFIDEAALSNPHGRLTRPRDVAEAIVALTAAPGSWITGNTIGVDGGELHAAGHAWARHGE